MIVDEYIRKPIEQLVSQDIFLFGRETVLELLFHSYFKFIILLLISGICSLVLYWLIRIYHISENAKFKYLSRPELVDMENIDNYDRAN